MVKYLQVSDRVYETLTVELGDRGASTVTAEAPRANSLQNVHGQRIFESGIEEELKEALHLEDTDDQSDPNKEN